MASLPRELRKQLENAVKKARRAADAGARNALEGLAVMQGETSRTMSKKERDLRNRLRAHGRQLGDELDTTKGTQAVNRLASEVAYEHWHRMLFARFLAECDLLIEPESGMAVSIDEVHELAREQGADWVELASAWAQRMLPQIFRSDDPVLEVSLPPETRQELESILEALPRETFVANDSLGWCYQFWQAERKDEVNAAGNKIGADELPAVTQLFTEDYMVDFLLDNTLGAWHAGKVLAAKPTLAASAKSEEDLRKAVALPGCAWKYLRFIKNKDGQWTPAAGTFDGWPKTAKELKCLDPCMGSGHFIVAMFGRLVALRMAEEKLDEAAAVAAAIRDNLFGLEIDPRCTQIGAFNLALAAWRRVGHCTLPAMNLACCGLAPNTREADWLAMAGDNEKLKNGMARLFQLFKDAPVLGSLVNPRVADSYLLEAGFHELQPLLEKALTRETKDDTAHEMAVTARGLAKAADILGGQFTLVATNVPYLGRGKQNEVLQGYCERVHWEAKADLATCFVERCLEFSGKQGSNALVTPQNWLFLGTYRTLRNTLLKQAQWNWIARLGPKGFHTPMWDFNIVLLSLSGGVPSPQHCFTGIDVSTESSPAAKAAGLEVGSLIHVLQKGQLGNPDSRVGFESLEGRSLLRDLANTGTGMQTFDSPRFLASFWELKEFGKTWILSQSTVSTTSIVGGRVAAVRWENGKGSLYQLVQDMAAGGYTSGIWRAGSQFWGNRGVLVSLMGGIPCTVYDGVPFNNNTGAVVPKDASHLLAIWTYCSSSVFAEEVRKVDQKLNVTNATLAKVPFDLAHWQKLAAEKYPHGLPKPFSTDPTQWLFGGAPKGSDQPLHVAVARLLGYLWPRQSGSSFPDCPALGPDGLEALADEDGIVCLFATKGEAPAAERLRELLACAWGKEWHGTVLQELLADADYSGQTLDDWLRDGLFEQHCSLFHQAPFLWHLWDGRRDGFNVIVNYHKLAGLNGEGRRTLEKLIYTYLGDWTELQRRDQKQGIEGADGRLAAADHLRSELTKILEGESPYDLFIRWKALHEQPIGWEPDINDGVRINSRPFVTARTLSGKSIFRVQPKFKWGKDRGKEPTRPKEDYPWFWGWDETTEDFAGGKTFDGNRWNDLHYTRAIKEAARERAATRQTKASGRAKPEAGGR
jgi:hypothetical protein